MLQKIEREILKTISKHPHKFELEAEQLKPYSGEDIRIAMDSLKEKGYFKSSNSSINSLHFTYELTTQGRFYKEYHLQRFAGDIIIPIVVSVITALITTLLCG